MTTTALKTFTFVPGLDLRSIDRDGSPWFVVLDVCRALGLTNTAMALEGMDADDRITVKIADGNRGNPNKALVNEAGLYALILKSRKPEAKAFQKWVTGTVLPSIRKNGGYMTPEVAKLAVE